MALPCFLLLLLLLLSTTTIAASSSTLPFAAPNDDVLALIVFKSSISDPTSALNTWNESQDTPCNWAHVQCDPSSSRVVGLSLSSLSLSGPLPRALDRLRFLRTLSLASNNLSGDIPPLLSLLPSLSSLDLSRNRFTGRIPGELGNLPSLRSLDLSGNLLSGPVPESLFSANSCSSLRYLSLAGNLLEGPLPLSLQQCGFLLHLDVSNNRLSGSPDGIWSLSRLRAIDVSGNSFSGGVPEKIAHIFNLKAVKLSGNGFSGPIPVGLGLCPHLIAVDFSSNSFSSSLPSSMRLLRTLSTLDLSNNAISGELPSWLGQLSMLQQLDLSSNRLIGEIPTSLGELKELSSLSLSANSLTGAIPESMGDCWNLSEVRLSGNQLNGSIPQSLLHLGLQVLDLSSNKFAGTMPPGSARLSESLRYLDFSANQLTGALPPEMALYFKLSYLNLSWNGFYSRLPPELGSFRNLSVLDLRSSGLFGPVPAELCDSGGLTVLQLDGNSLAGTIPAEIGNCSSLYLLSLSHNGLSGSIPATMAKLTKLKILNLEFNALSGEIPQQLGALGNLLAVNISHNRLIGRLPVAGIFPTLDRSALEGNLGLCSPLVAEPCKLNVPKPLVLDPNAYYRQNGDDVAAATTSPLRSKRPRFLSVSSIIAVSAALVILVGALVVTLLNMSARRRMGLLENALESMCSSSTKSSVPAAGKVVLFSPRRNLRPEDLAGASELLLKNATELGRGVFGTTYKATVGEGQTVAIKKLAAAHLVQYHDDFDREVRTLAKAKHPNLMSLQGYYWTPHLQLLISDYAAGGSLHARLHEAGSGELPPLSWMSRFKIALGVAKGLAHLHQSFRPPIIHYDVKPHNILLDDDMNPRVIDFGLARMLPRLEKHLLSNRFQSAMGYMAPEMACQSLRANEKCDVYGFGVVLLELVTGRRAVEYGEDDVVLLVDEVRVMVEQGNAMECVAKEMGEFPEEEVLPVMKLGLVCTSQIPSSRPSMAEVVQIMQVIKAPVLVGQMDDY